MHSKSVFALGMLGILLLVFFPGCEQLNSDGSLGGGATSDDPPSSSGQIDVFAIDPAAAEMGAANGTLSTQKGTFEFRRYGDLTSPININISTSGTATDVTNLLNSGVDVKDYVSLPSVVTIPAGSDHVMVDVVPIEDFYNAGPINLVEAPETVQIDIEPGAGYSPGVNPSATVTITEEDPIPAAGLNPPMNLRLVHADPFRIDLAWDDMSSTETRFWVYWNMIATSGLWVIRNFTAANTPYFTELGGSPNQTYYFMIGATDGTKTTYSNVLRVDVPAP